jgi:hypothetical protein
MNTPSLADQVIVRRIVATIFFNISQVIDLTTEHDDYVLSEEDVVKDMVLQIFSRICPIVVSDDSDDETLHSLPDTTTQVGVGGKRKRV